MEQKPKVLRIIIDAVGDNPTATVTVGEEIYTINGIALFADGGDQHLLSFFWGSPQVAAAACVKSFAQAIRSENKPAVQFYQYLLRFMCKVTGTGANEMTPEDALRMFEAEEVYNTAKKSPKEFN